MPTSSHSGIAVPGLLRIPPEIRAPILRDVLMKGQEQWVPHYNRQFWGFPLHRFKPGDSPEYQDFREYLEQKSDDYASVAGLLFSCKFLHEECLALLLDNTRFLVRLNLMDQAPTGANDFAYITSLRPDFRSSITNLALHIMVPRPFKGPPQSGGPSAQFRYMMDPDNDPLLFEQVVENINELLHLMPGLKNIHMMWDVWLGNTGVAWAEESSAKRVWARIAKEWPGRQIHWTGSHSMGCYDAERSFDRAPVCP